MYSEKKNCNCNNCNAFARSASVNDGKTGPILEISILFTTKPMMTHFCLHFSAAFILRTPSLAILLFFFYLCIVSGQHRPG